MTGSENFAQLYIKRERSSTRNVLESLLLDDNEIKEEEEEEENSEDQFHCIALHSSGDKMNVLPSSESSTLTYGSDVIDVDYFTENSIDLSSNDDDDLDNENFEDNQTEIYLQNFLHSIDLLVFDDFSKTEFPSTIVANLPEKLLEECSIWRQKFLIKKTKSTKQPVILNSHPVVVRNRTSTISKIRSHSSTISNVYRTPVPNKLSKLNNNNENCNNMKHSLELSFPKLSICDNTITTTTAATSSNSLRPIGISRNRSFDEDTNTRLPQTYQQIQQQQQKLPNNFLSTNTNQLRTVPNNYHHNSPNKATTTNRTNSGWHRLTLPPIVQFSSHQKQQSKSQHNIMPTTTATIVSSTSSVSSSSSQTNVIRPLLTSHEWNIHVTNVDRKVDDDNFDDDDDDDNDDDDHDPLLLLRKYSSNNQLYHHNSQNRINSALTNHNRTTTTTTVTDKPGYRNSFQRKQNQYRILLRNKMFNTNNNGNNLNSDNNLSLAAARSSVTTNVTTQSFRLPSIDF